MRKRHTGRLLRPASTTVAITAAFAFAALSFLGKAFHVGANILLGAILAVLGSILLYTFARTEKLAEDVSSIRDATNENSTSVEIFNSRDEWASRPSSESLRSVEVSTQMFSDVKLGRDMDAYFSRIHREIRANKLPFRRLALITDRELGTQL